MCVFLIFVTFPSPHFPRATATLPQLTNMESPCATPPPRWAAAADAPRREAGRRRETYFKPYASGAGGYRRGGDRSCRLGLTTWQAVCRLTQVLRGRGAKRGELRGAACAGQGRAGGGWRRKPCAANPPRRKHLQVRQARLHCRRMRGVRQGHVRSVEKVREVEQLVAAVAVFGRRCRRARQYRDLKAAAIPAHPGAQDFICVKPSACRPPRRVVD
jgi:hypothetical protein